MGPLRLIRVVLFCTLLVACSGGRVREASQPKEAPRPLHAQIFRALTTPQRGVIADQFRARNGPLWKIGGEEEGRGATDIDRFHGFIRRAFRRDTPPASAAPKEEEAVAVAQAFVKKNADLLGIPTKEVVDLETKALPLPASAQPTPATHWMARVSGSFPTRGFEAFRDLEGTIEIWIYVDDDRETRFLLNFSKVHTGLAIATNEKANDAVTASKLVGRRVFALEDDPSKPAASVRVLKRIPLGVIEATDVKRRDLTVHVSEGPMQAWLVYRLAYKVQVEKRDPTGAFFYFWYIVDADTGDVIEDAVPPLVTPIP